MTELGIVVNGGLLLFAATLVVYNLLSKPAERASIPAPLLALVVGVLVGPAVLGLVEPAMIGANPHESLEQLARVTLAVGLAGVAFRLPHGYWLRRWKWVAAAILLGMPLMMLVASGVLSAMLGVPLLVAIAVAACITPTDPVVTTPIVTGGVATSNVPDHVRLDLSSESGINDGLGYLFVLAPVLLMTKPAGQAWHELFVKVLLLEILGAVAFGVIAGALLGGAFRVARANNWMSETAYLGVLLPFALVVLGGAKLLHTDGVLAVFVAAAVAGQIIPQDDEKRQSEAEEAFNRFIAVPLFVVLGIALPYDAWGGFGLVVPLALLVALLARRVIAMWAIRPLVHRTHARADTAFVSWFGALGVSAVFYALLAERRTGDETIFPLVSLAVVMSVAIHGLTAAPFSRLLHRAREHAGL